MKKLLLLIFVMNAAGVLRPHKNRLVPKETEKITAEVLCVDNGGISIGLGMTKAPSLPA